MIILTESNGITPEEFKQNIEQVASMYPNRVDLKFTNSYKMVLQYGRFYKPQPRPKGYQKDPDKQCYRNAAMLAFEHPELTYCEGFSSMPEIPAFPVAHAWCIDHDGNVIDPTWRTPGLVYFGIPFSTKFLKQTTQARKIWGLIPDMPDKKYNPFKDGFPDGSIIK